MTLRDYTILQADTASQLESAVKDHVKFGYVPIGGVSVSITRSDRLIERIFCQAMAIQDFSND